MAPTFPFLTGCERSGTTMLRAMVDAHPQVAVPDESHFLPALAARRHEIETGPPSTWNGWSGCCKTAPGSAGGAGTRPRSPMASAMLPEARFVHLIRDGRNVALSLLQLPWGPGTVEDLATSPAAELARVTEFLHIPWDDRMLQYHDQSSADILQRMPEGRQQAHRNLSRPPSTTLRDWRRELPAASQLAFEALAGDLLEDLGYERRFASVTVLACPDECRALLDRQRRRRSA